MRRSGIVLLTTLPRRQHGYDHDGLRYLRGPGAIADAEALRTLAIVSQSGFLTTFFGIVQLHRLAWHDGRDRVLVHELRMAIAAQQYTKIVERRYNAGEFDAVDQKNR